MNVDLEQSFHMPAGSSSFCTTSCVRKHDSRHLQHSSVHQRCGRRPCLAAALPPAAERRGGAGLLALHPRCFGRDVADAVESSLSAFLFPLLHVIDFA